MGDCQLSSNILDTIIFMDKICIKKVVRLSRIRDRATEELEEMRRSPELDPAFFTDEELEHYIGVLIRSHEDDRLVIDDRDERVV